MEKSHYRPRSQFWNRALERYRAELGEKEEDEYQSILEAGTLEGLVGQIKTIQPPKAKARAIVNRLELAMKFINDFSAGVATCFGVDAKLTAIVWGSIRLILTLASSTSETLRDVVDMLEELSLTLPRFRYREKTLPIDDSFESDLVHVYTELICFCARTIHLYRSNPPSLLRSNAWADFNGDFSKTILRIKRLSSAVECEAEAARIRLDRNNYAEVLDVIESVKKNKMSTVERPCYCVPSASNSRFWGRKQILDNVRQALDPIEGQYGQRSYALWGIGGVGKSQIALHYASKSRSYYDSIVWVAAENTVQISQSFRVFALQLDLIKANEASEDSMAAMMKIKEWFNTTSQRWLLILDNAGNSDALKLAWPQDAQGSILVTTRSSNVAFSKAADGFQIQPFGNTEGADMLLKLTHLDPHSSSNQELGKAIAHALGGLPLALNQIAGFINQRKIPLRDFLPLYQRNADRIDAKKTGITDYEHSLGTVWEMSLKGLTGPSYKLQRLLAFLDSDQVDEIVLIEGAKKDRNPAGTDLEFLYDEMDLLDAEQILLQLALINKDGETGVLSIHRLVQAAVMRRLTTEERAADFAIVTQFLTWGFPDTWSKDIGHQHQSWGKSEKCLPHVFHLVKQKDRYGIIPEYPNLFAQLLLRCCWYLYERECYCLALGLINIALDSFTETNTLAFASAVELLGLINMDLNHQQRALVSFTRAMDIRATLLDPDDAFIAASLTTLGIVHTELVNLEEAYAYHQKAIDIRLRTNSDRIGNSYSNMASLLVRMGKADDAEEMLKRCPSPQEFTDETFLKTGNPRFSGDMVLLARIRQQQDRHTEALRLASKALGFRQKLLGNKLKTCDSLYQVAGLLIQSDNIASATNLLDECVAISQSLPEGDRQLARALYKLSVIYGKQGKTELSEEHSRRARELKHKIKGNATQDSDEANDEEEVYNRLNLWMLW